MRLRARAVAGTCLSLLLSLVLSACSSASGSPRELTMAMHRATSPSSSDDAAPSYAALPTGTGETAPATERPATKAAQPQGVVNSAPGEEGQVEVEVMLLDTRAVLVTKNRSHAQPEVGDVLLLGEDERIEAFEAGMQLSLSLDPVFMESDPPGVTVVGAEVLATTPKTRQISFESGLTIAEILPEARVVDVRSVPEYAEGHIAGAVNIPIDELKQRVRAEDFALDTPMILYCRSGNRSATAARILNELGYRVVLDMGGLLDYEGNVVVND